MSKTANSVHISIKMCSEINAYIILFSFSIFVIRDCFVLRYSNFEFILIKKNSLPPNQGYCFELYRKRQSDAYPGKNRHYDYNQAC